MIEKRKIFHDRRFGSIEFLRKKRFSFVDNCVLQENLAISTQHIMFLYALADEYELPGAAEYSVFKTIIIYTKEDVDEFFLIVKAVIERVEEAGIGAG